jgi:predicted DCC family thiol-disulfide oxidoreductase YuxK
MRYLTLIYDRQCGLCTRLGGWLAAQPKWMGIRLLPSDEASIVYPTLAQRVAREELVAVSDEGAIYLGDHAWLMCLYALKEYRSWAKRLSTSALLPLARSAFAILSANRRQISKWLQLRSDDELAVQLNAVQPPRCHGSGA